MKEEDVVFSLIKKACEDTGSVFERKVFRMALLLNIHPDKYNRIKDKLIERGRIVVDGPTFSIP